MTKELNITSARSWVSRQLKEKELSIFQKLTSSDRSTHFIDLIVEKLI